VAGSERSDGPEADIQGHRCALTLAPNGPEADIQGPSLRSDPGTHR